MLRPALLLAVLGLGSASAQSQFELGTHYNRLTPTQPTSSSPLQVEVAAIFHYGCPDCYAFEPYLRAWETGAAEYVSFVRIPAVWNPLVRLHAQAFYTAQVLGREAELHEPLFAEIHENGNALDSPGKLAEFFGRFGVGRQEFDDAFNSREVNARLQRAEELSRRYQVRSIPSIVVNGKYTSNATQTGSFEQLIELIDTLAASERGAN